MCRFVAYLGRPILLSQLVTEPENSIIHQSFASKERTEPLNGDGFGLAWYVPHVTTDAVSFRSTTPAWSNQNLRHLAKVTHSSCVFAHVRAASDGMPVTETNTHPFVWGPYAFMHNGEVAEFQRVRRLLLNRLSDAAYSAIEGTTDSEHLFALLLDELPKLDGEPNALTKALSRAVQAIIDLGVEARTSGTSYLNLAVTDGRSLVACRAVTGDPLAAPSLHIHTGKLYTCQTGTAALLEANEADHSVLVASEPLTADASWRELPPNHLVTVSEDRQVEITPLDLER